MTLIKTGFFNGIAVAVRVITGLWVTKMLAVYVGPAGYAMIGQFGNAMVIITNLAGGAINSGVTKYTSEYWDDDAKQRRIWQTAIVIALAGSLIGALVTAALHRDLAAMFLHDAAHGGVFLWLAAALPLLTLNALLLAILNGKKELLRLVGASIAGSLIGMVMMSLLAWQAGLEGALVALAVNQAVALSATFYLCRGKPWFRLRSLCGRVDWSIARKLGGFAVMALTTAAVGPLSQILIREHLAERFGWVAAGNWQAVTRVSDMYLMLITATLGVYYLPRLSELRDAVALKREIAHGYRIILPVTIAGAGTIYLLRDWIVFTLFSSEFRGMRDLFAWQLTGDVFKIGSWLLGYLMVARAMTRVFVTTEILFTATLVGFTFLLTPVLGVQGAVAAFSVNYLLYWVTLAWILGRDLPWTPQMPTRP